MSQIIQPIVITQNDYGYQIPFTLEDGNGNALNLTGASLSFKVQSAQDPTGALIFSNPMVIDSPTAGTCHYLVQSTDFISPGTYLAQIAVTYSGQVVSYSGIQIIVQPALPKSIN